jgi:hypothetical protein
VDTGRETYIVPESTSVSAFEVDIGGHRNGDTRGNESQIKKHIEHENLLKDTRDARSKADTRSNRT